MARSSISASLRRIIVSRANGCCEYCKSPADFSTEPFSIEHILPRARGGGNEAENLACACSGCNVYKSDQVEFLDVVSQQMVPLFNPRTMNWQEHFVWDDSFTSLVGQTAIGRVTIEAIRLNRKPLKNLRRALMAIGEHPPVL